MNPSEDLISIVTRLETKLAELTFQVASLNTRVGALSDLPSELSGAVSFFGVVRLFGGARGFLYPDVVTGRDFVGAFAGVSPEAWVGSISKDLLRQNLPGVIYVKTAHAMLDLIPPQPYHESVTYLALKICL